MTKYIIGAFLLALAMALFAATTLTNGGVVFQTFATHPDVPPVGGLLLWAKTDGTLQSTNSVGTDAPVGGAGGSPDMFRPPVAVDNTTGWTDYGSPTGRTIDTSNPGIVIISSAAPGSGLQQQGRKMAVTAPFDKIFVLSPLIQSDGGGTEDFASGGIFASDAAGKAATCALEGYIGTTGTFVQHFNVDSAAVKILIPSPLGTAVGVVNDPFNDLSTGRLFPKAEGMSMISYWRLKDAAGTLSCMWSPDGYSWLTIWSTPDTAYLTAPTAVGYFVNGGSVPGANKVYMIVRGVE